MDLAARGSKRPSTSLETQASEIEKLEKRVKKLQDNLGGNSWLMSPVKIGGLHHEIMGI